MKRARIQKIDDGGPCWHIDAWDSGQHVVCEERPTLQEALDAALEAVGLDRSAEHREAP